MFGYGTNSNYGYGYPSVTNSSTLAAQANLASVYGSYANAYAANGYSQAINPAYGYGTTPYATTKPQSADNPYGYGNIRIPNNVPVGFTSAGTLSSTQAALGSLYPSHSAAMTGSVASGTHFEPYDAALLAVTSDYLKSHGNLNWVPEPPKNPASTFPTRKKTGVGYRAPPKDPKAYFCETCKISCAGPQAFKEHIAGKNHKKREAIETGKNQISLPKNKITFRCDICELTCTGKDTYDAHVKGSRHAKTMNLFKKMGKPIPTGEPTIIAPVAQKLSDANSVPVGGIGPSEIPKPTKIVGVTGTKFVGGQTLQSTTMNLEKDVIEAALEAESQIKPIGEEYVDSKYDASGKLIEYHCRLCECSFSDPNAKAVHTKGRRHRLAYKNKVDPRIKVELKNSVLVSRMKKDRKHGMSVDKPQNLFNDQQSTTLPHTWFDANNAMLGGNPESDDDRHVLAKYEELKLDAVLLEKITALYELAEKALKTTSDILKDADCNGVIPLEVPAEVEVENKKPEAEQKEQEQPERLLKGLMKVGLFANGLLLKDDEKIDLVLLCSKIPTKNLLRKVSELMVENFDPAYKDKIDVAVDYDDAAIVLRVQEFEFYARISLTCVLMRAYEGTVKDSENKPELPLDHLPLIPCLESLAELRRAKWYQARVTPNEMMGIVMTVLRDVRKRVHTWHPFSTYMLALFTQNVLDSFEFPMSPGDAFRRVFEAISSCVLLTRRATMVDPCEKEQVDVMEKLTRQEREDITSSAQHALRLIIFDQIDKILDMPRLPEKTVSSRKRVHDPTENTGMEVELKKEKRQSVIL
uniref:DZF domain-containing protein n=1 Tax=Panagrolaimus sp. JU765 TaxID=591449 RepID=A0AC34QZ99_9BILA